MDSIRQYLVGIVAAAILCGIANALVPQKGAVGTAVKFLSGILMTLAVLSRWTDISVDGLWGWPDEWNRAGQEIVTEGENMALDAYRNGIKTRTESYILEKANSLGTELTVNVTLSGGEMPVPIGATLNGSISPYAKQQLSRILEEELGIIREEQVWIG